MSQVRFLLNQFKLPKNGKIYLKKGMFFIIKINKSERDQLVKMGVNLGESGISKTHSRHSGITYYMCTSNFNMQCLSKIRK